MHTVQTFFKPGLESAEDVFASIPQPPRTVQPAGQRLAILWRILVCLISFVTSGCLVSLCYQDFIDNAHIISWIVIIALIPFCIFFVPWRLITTYISAMKSFRYCQNIYQNGSIAMGNINTLTKISGQELICHHTERTWSIAPTKIRIDYTFNIENTVKTGSALLSEQTLNYLSMNSDICVLYLPDNPSENMIFPIPGNEFFEYKKF